MRLAELVAGVLAVWRLSSLLTRERGPGDLFVKVRALAGIKHYWPEDFSEKQRADLGAYLSPGDPYDYPDTFLGGLLECAWCLSVWLAAPVAWLLWDSWADRLVGWLALSGGAIVVEEHLKD